MCSSHNLSIPGQRGKKIGESDKFESNVTVTNRQQQPEEEEFYRMAARWQFQVGKEGFPELSTISSLYGRRPHVPPLLST